MGQAYEIGPIADDQVDSAYLLARLVIPSLELERWRERCARSQGPGSEEIVVAANPRGHVQGLAISDVVWPQQGSPILDVSSFVVVSAADQPGVGLHLFEHLAQRARRANCQQIRVHLLDRSAHVVPVDAPTQVIEALARADPRAIS